MQPPFHTGTSASNRGALAQLPSSPSSDAAGDASPSSADGRIEALEFSEVVQRRRMVRHCSSRLRAPEANGQAVAGGAVTALRRARMRRERVTSPAKQMPRA
jgi:hypothetical protein